MTGKRAPLIQQLLWLLAIWALSVACFAAAVYGFRGLLPRAPAPAAGMNDAGPAKLADAGRRKAPGGPNHA